MNALRLLLALCLLLCGGGLRAQEPLPVPPLTGRIVDQVGLLTATQRGALDAKLADVEARSGPQVVLLLVASTQPEDIAAYAQRVADQWKIGRREVGDGLLIVVAKNDRRIRIEVAKALEGAVPDLAARQIIDRSISPAFKAGDYAGGLNAGVDALIARLQGEHLPAPAARPPAASSSGEGFAWDELAMFFFVGVPVVGAVLTRMLGRKLGALATAGGAGALAWVLSTSMLIAAIAGVLALVLVGVLGFGATRGGRAAGGFPMGWGGLGGGTGGSWGGSGGGSDGGGFSSGGGGDFGGGGASGDW